MVSLGHRPPNVGQLAKFLDLILWRVSTAMLTTSDSHSATGGHISATSGHLSQASEDSSVHRVIFEHTTIVTD